MKGTVIVLLLALAVAVSANLDCSTPQYCDVGDTTSRMNIVMPIKLLEREECRIAGACPNPSPKIVGSKVSCVNGHAGEYECNNIDLLSYINFSDLGCGNNAEGNDIWGWTNPDTGDEIAVMCCTTGTSFVNVTDPEYPVVLGFTPTNTVSSPWRDAKVYNGYAFIVSEAVDHGMQIVNLANLGHPIGPGVPEIEPDVVYTEFGSSHNIVINEETGFAYSVGTRTCNAGLHIVDISNPLDPTFVDCYALDGYVHDAQCLIYHGPDSDYFGHEICFMYDEDTVTIVDVTDKSNMVQLSRTPYPDNMYTHQGWITDDHKYVLSNDELDEMDGDLPNHQYTRTLIWDVTDLNTPVHTGNFISSETSIDHNLYILGDYAFESNYCAGLRVLDLSNIADAKLTEYGYFDVSPECDRVQFMGTWSNYPYFPSGNIIVSSIEKGLFVLALQ